MTDLIDHSTSVPASGAAALLRVLGARSRATLLDGRTVEVAQLNNAATTPPFERTVREVTEFLSEYGALHRGAGPRARATVETVERAVDRIGTFIGQPPGNGLLFTSNTSAAIN